MAELEAREGPAGDTQCPAADEAALREVALLRGRVLELEAACSAETLNLSPAADEAALREVALLRSRVLELEAACSSATLDSSAAAPQQADAPCSPAPDLDSASHADVLELESAAHGKLAALQRCVLQLEAAHSSVQAAEGAGPWWPASSDSSANEAGPSMALLQDGVQSDQVALCPMPSRQHTTQRMQGRQTRSARGDYDKSRIMCWSDHLEDVVGTLLRGRHCQPGFNMNGFIQFAVREG